MKIKIDGYFFQILMSNMKKFKYKLIKANKNKMTTHLNYNHTHTA